MFLLLSLAIVLLLTRVYVSAQVASSAWNLNISTSTTDRVRLAGAALDVAIDRLSADGLFDDEPYGVAGNLFSQMAQFDIATNQTKYATALAQYLKLQENMDKNFSDPYDLAAGKIAGKNFTLTKVCRNATMVGGTFWDDELKEPSIAGSATGYFLVISALLAEATSDPLYLQAANESAEFIRSQLYNVRDIVQEYVSTDVNTTGCEVLTSTAPTNSGLMIEGLSILWSLTKDASIQNLLSNLLLAVIPNTAWQGDNGIVAVQGGTGDPKTGDLNLLQGLGTVYMRNSINSTLRQYVGDYIAVQFNAVTSLATSSDTNIYGSSWIGPPSANFSGTNQTIALGALISAIGLNDSSSPSSPTISPSASSTAIPSPKAHNLAAILGGTLGGLAVIVLGTTLLWCLRRQRSHPQQGSAHISAQLEPFLTTTLNSSTGQSSRMGRGEKRGEPQDPPTTSVTHLASSHRAGSPTINSSINPEGDLGNVTVENHPASVLPTEHLVRILNQRLQTRQWDTGETPPDYPVSTSGR
ncbi:Glycoside hydrolase family 76 protein [Mycena venus]|uniref:Glycoside hydrolase family 76 protein n=1 Tax=Mycena venus TaxID=2733690 RepID=A0A8H6YF65_9AGAR|nr:Glycoside hydrolase family 76 protein [Mycena venus]